MLTESFSPRLAFFAAAFALSGALIAASGADAKPAAKPAKPEEAKPAATATAAPSNGGGKPEQLATFGDWGAYAAQTGKAKTCYALGSPKDRSPKAKLKDVTAYVFISTRPAENIHNEVAINLGYATKDGSAASADIDGADWELITKGTNAWVKDQGKEKEFVGALRGGSKMVVKATSAKGTTTVDTYSLKGLGDALARVVQECK